MSSGGGGGWGGAPGVCSIRVVGCTYASGGDAKRLLPHPATAKNGVYKGKYENISNNRQT